MSELQFQIQGMPYVAGQARGILQNGLDSATADHIVLLEQAGYRLQATLPGGFIVVDAAPFSHGMIPLLGIGVPTVIISAAQASALVEGSEILLDGGSGRISLADPNKPPVITRHSGSTTTADGVRIQLRVSARDAVAARRARLNGADAIGLVRSEFLLPSAGEIPDEAFYRREFQALCEAAKPLPVTIRLLDIATDKRPAWLPSLAGATGTLGLQGVRLFDHEPVSRVYRAQLAAIASLDEYFDIAVLIPYLTHQDELLQRVEQIRQVLGSDTPIGAMAETPAAALQLPDWLEHVDFIGLGCNDLMQCLFGADRDQPELRGYLDPCAPALFRFLRQVANSAPQALQRVQLCGVLAQLPGILPVLLGLGFRVFSVEAASLDDLRQVIAVTSTVSAAALAAEVCAAHTASEVRAILAGSGQ